MRNDTFNVEEQQRRVLQEYIFNLEDIKEEAEAIAVANTRLKQSQDMLMAVLESTVHGICLFKNGLFCWCNKALTDILGWGFEEFIGKTPENIRLSAEHCHNVLRATQELDLAHKDGHLVPCLVTGRHFDANDPSKGCVVSITDFTEQKRMAEEISKHRDRLEEVVEERTIKLHDVNEQLRQEISDRRKIAENLIKIQKAVDSSSDAIGMSTPQGIHNYQNQAFTDLFGYALEEISKQSLASDIALDSNHVYADPDVRREIFTTIMQGGSWKGEVEMITKSGHRIAVFLRADAVKDDKGDIIGLIGIHTDITARKLLEAHLRQAQKMEAIGTLAGGIAHDFNNMLAAIIGYTEMAKFQPHSEKQKYYLDQVLRASDRAKMLVDQILAFSRQQAQEKSPLVFAAVIREAIRMLRASIPTTIHIKCSTPDASIMVLADPSQLQQILMNLCSNAAHAMREGGGILRIDLDREKLEERQIPGLIPGEYARLTVTDTGHGMAPSIGDRIFDPFFTTKGPGEGTGLGLSVVYGIVKNYGGAIDVNSAPGKGTTVRIYIPLFDGGDEDMAEQVSEEITGGAEQILFIDDESALAEVGKMMLTSLGYRVTSTVGSMDALEMFRERPQDFDLVVTDMTMPNMTGADLAKELLKIRPDIPVILCTGFSDIISEEKAKAMGIRRFIMKPLFRKDLATVIRAVLDER